MADAEGKKNSGKTGRPMFEPTPKQREQVEALSGLLVRHEEIGRFIGIDDKTLRRHFRTELDTGREATVRKLKSIVYAAARQGSLRAACYLLDRLAVWPEPENAGGQQRVEVIVRGGIAAIPQANGHDTTVEAG